MPAVRVSFEIMSPKSKNSGTSFAQTEAQYAETVVVALGGNAINNKTSPGTISNLAPIGQAISKATWRGLVLTHGNGPQVGYLNEIQPASAQQSLDILGAETEGWLGYIIEQTIAGHLPESQESVSVLTRMQVDNDDPALRNPDKPIGQWFSQDQARQLRAERSWHFRQRGNRYRRVVPSPTPINCLQINSIKALLAAGSVVICAGGGGIPVAKNAGGQFTGLEAVIDKDLASALIAEQLDAELLVLATDVAGVYSHWPPQENDSDTKTHCHLQQATPEQLQDLEFEAGSMAPKVAAACRFTTRTGKPAMIGHLNDLEQLLQQRSGTRIISRRDTNGARISATGA